MTLGSMTYCMEFWMSPDVAKITLILKSSVCTWKLAQGR